MLRQLLLTFGFFALVLVLISWVNQAVLLFDQLIANGETAAVFVEFSTLTLPLVITIVLPIAAFAATVFVTNRMSSENELVVAQTAGYGPFRIARPVLFFGLLIGSFVLVLNHVLVPMSQERLAQRKAEIAENITARFLTEGTFAHPADGITIYIRKITRVGEMRDIFLSDVRDEARHVTYSAQRALVVRSADGPRLVMFQGLVQILEVEDDRLTITAFDDFTYNLSALIGDGFLTRRNPWYLPTADLLRADPDLIAESRSSRARFLFEAHNRSSLAAFAVIAALIGFSTLLLGGFSRFGLWGQIFGAVVLLAGFKFLDNAVGEVARANERLVLLVYLPGLVGLVGVAVILWLSANLGAFKRRRNRGASA